MMQQMYQFRYLVTVDNERFMVKVYIYEKCKFEDALLVLKPKKSLSIFLGDTVFVE